MNSAPHVLSITSGKGGVGKTNLSVNIACQLAKKGKKVLLLDADLGLANVDVVLGLTPQKNLLHLFQGEATLDEIIFKTPYDFSILPASSGTSNMLNLSPGQKMTLLDSVDNLKEDIDYLIVDTSAGIHDNVLYFNTAAEERIIVLTTEPTSLTDAYALIKVLKMNYDVSQFRVIVNMADTPKQAKDVFRRLSSACDHFLENISLDYLGFIPKDKAVREASRMQKSFSLVDSNSPASQALESIVQNILAIQSSHNFDGNIKFFWKKLLFRDEMLETSG